VFLHAPIPQSQSYHQFADQRRLLGIPNGLDVLSNAIFLAVGLPGILFLLSRNAGTATPSFALPQEKVPHVVFFLGVVLTGFGSAYYHWKPGNDRLVWDRLPMTIGFTAFFAAMIAERISVKAGLRLLLPLAAAGITSIVYWHWSELRGAGDLRPYILVQFYPLLGVVLLTSMFPSRYTGTAILFTAIGFYALAKLFESFDAEILNWTRVVSGHTLKHLAAGMAAYLILRMLRARRSVAAAE
jgi:hypothetical protein